MRTIVNRTHKPLKIHLPGGKVLHLGPAKTGQISDQAADDPAVRKLVQAGEVEIAGEEENQPRGPGGAGGAAPEATHGHPPTTAVHPKGNR